MTQGLVVCAWEHKLTGVVRQLHDRPSTSSMAEGDYEPLVRQSEAADRITSLEAEVERLTKATQELEESVSALEAERQNIIATKREQIERLTNGLNAEGENHWKQRDRAETLSSQLKEAVAALTAVSETSHRARDRKHYRFPIAIMQKVDNALHSIREDKP